MRLLFLILLLVNGILFLWGQGYLGTQQDAGREPERMTRQIIPEKLSILSEMQAQTACKRLEWLSMAEATTIRKTLADLPDWQITQLPRKKEPAHWVVVASLPSRTVAEKKIAELRRIGVKEGEIVEDPNIGPFAVSFGVFRNPDLADELLKVLTKRGVRSAQITQREMGLEQFAIQFQAPADILEKKMPELMSVLPQTSMLDCAQP